MRSAVILAVLLVSGEAFAGSPGSDGLGFVPGLRVGAVKGSFDGVAGAEGGSSWGHTIEFHTDLLKTFGGDRYAVGAGLGYLWQSGLDRDSETLALEPGAFGHSGVSLTGFLAASIGTRNSASVRAGVVSGYTETAMGTIDAGLYRAGVQLTHVWTVSLFDLAGAVGAEYFTGTDEGGRGYTATAITFDLTGAFAF